MNEINVDLIRERMRVTFAAAALQSMMDAVVPAGTTREEIAAEAWRWADAMMAVFDHSEVSR